MIEALALAHLWSLAVAGGAWFLQRDGNGQVGSSFPVPTVWLILIAVCLLPGAIHVMPLDAYIQLPEIQTFEAQALQTTGGLQESGWSPNLLMLYLGGGCVLMARTLWRWLMLQRLPLEPTDQPGVFSMHAQLPPLTLSWPARAIAIPEGIEAKPSLIRHEQAHLRHNDGEVTLLLLLLQDLMLRNPGIGYLVRQWRLAIELRADKAATEMLSVSDRKEYAALLLESHRPASGNESPLPCPTAQLRNSNHREIKMRLVEIIGIRPDMPGRDWRAAVTFALVGAGVVGFASVAVAAANKFVDLGSAKVGYATQASPPLPASCQSYQLEEFSPDEALVIANDRLVPGYKMRLGTVVLHHDVRRDGSIHNPRVLASTNRCFEAEAKAALLQWTTEAQAYSLKDAAVKMHFTISGETPDELKQQIEDFRR